MCIILSGNDGNEEDDDEASMDSDVYSVLTTLFVKNAIKDHLSVGDEKRGIKAQIINSLYCFVKHNLFVFICLEFYLLLKNYLAFHMNRVTSLAFFLFNNNKRYYYAFLTISKKKCLLKHTGKRLNTKFTYLFT